MSTVKGFILVPAWENNTPGQVGQFGELSNLSESFSKEKGVYPHATDPLSLKTFTCNNDAGVPTTLTPATATALLAVANDLYTKYNAGTMEDFVSIGDMITYLSGAFTTGYTLFAAGAWVESTSGNNQHLPDYLTFTYTNSDGTFNVRFWFADASFQAQFDDYSIVVIPPVTGVDNLNDTPAAVATALANYTQATLVSDIETAKGSNPYTKLRSRPLTWNDPASTPSTIPTSWTALIYGPAGDTTDNINQAIIDYLEDTSAVDINTWKIIYPALFSNTEFYLVPGWGNIAINEVSPQTGIFSPTKTLAKHTSDILKYAVGYDATFVTDNATASFHVYNSLTFTSIGNVNNANGNIRIDQLFPDYIAVPSSSLDFARMSPETQAFASALENLFTIAATATSTSVLPAGYIRTNRGSYTFISAQLNDITLLCLAKYSYEL